MAERRQAKGDGGQPQPGGEATGARKQRGGRAASGQRPRAGRKRQTEGGQRARAGRGQAGEGRRQRGRPSEQDAPAVAVIEERLARIEQAVATQAELSEELLGRLDEVLKQASVGDGGS